MVPYEHSTAQEKAEATCLRFDRLETQCYCAKAASAFLVSPGSPKRTQFAIGLEFQAVPDLYTRTNLPAEAADVRMR